MRRFRASNLPLQGVEARLHHFCAASRWRQISAQEGIFDRRSEKSRRKAGTLMDCGQMRVHLPHAIHASGRLSAGSASTNMPMLKEGVIVNSL